MKRTYKVCIINPEHPHNACTPITLEASSPQSAVRLTVRHLIKSGEIRRQPLSVGGNFTGVTVWLL